MKAPAEAVTVPSIPFKKEEVPAPVVPITFEPAAPARPKGIRFAEEILAPPPLEGEEAAGKKPKKKGKREREDEAKAKKGRRAEVFTVEEEE